MSRQIVNRHPRGINDDICGAPNRSKCAGLGMNSFEKSAVSLKRVGASIRFITPNQCVRRRFKEEHSIGHSKLAQLFKGTSEVSKKLSGTYINNDSQTVHSPAVWGHHSHEGGKHSRWKIIDNVPVKIFKSASGTGSSCTRTAGDDHDFI